jgi:hypothetical protein
MLAATRLYCTAVPVERRKKMIDSGERRPPIQDSRRPRPALPTPGDDQGFWWIVWAMMAVAILVAFLIAAFFGIFLFSGQGAKPRATTAGQAPNTPSSATKGASPSAASHPDAKAAASPDQSPEQPAETTLAKEDLPSPSTLPTTSDENGAPEVSASPDTKPASDTPALAPEVQRPPKIVLEKYRSRTPSAKQAQGRSASGGPVYDLEQAEEIFIGDPSLRSMVFVIDRSSSMAAADHLPRVVGCLGRSLAALDDEQQFELIFFNTQPLTFYPRPRMIPATNGNQQRVRAWMAAIGADGGTDPRESMLLALQLKPDRIVLLSDGEFDPLFVEEITNANHQSETPVRIDGIGIAESIFTLQELAKRNGGIYYEAR